MKIRIALGAATLLGGAITVGLFLVDLNQNSAMAPAADRLERGRAIYAANCASCHGAELEGQPNWKSRLPTGRLPAPPHDDSGHTWHHPDGVLFRITKEGPAAVAGGGYQSDMPGFGGVLSDEEILAVLDYIKSTWSEREQQHQAEMSRREREASQ